MTIKTQDGSVEVIDHGEIYEIKDLKSSENKGLELACKALGQCKEDKPIYFTSDMKQANDFYRGLIEMGKIEISHVVFRKVR